MRWIWYWYIFVYFLDLRIMVVPDDCIIAWNFKSYSSSNVNEGIRAGFFFLQKDFTRTKSTKTHTSKQKQKRQHFYAHKKHLTWGKSLARLSASLWFLCFLCFLCFFVCETKKTAFSCAKKHLTGRKSLVWRFVFFALFMLFMLFMRIKNM